MMNDLDLMHHRSNIGPARIGRDVQDISMSHHQGIKINSQVPDS